MLRTILFSLLTVGVLIGNTGCSFTTHKLHTPAPVIHDQPQIPVTQIGKCSWYGPRFHGRKTSNGERFNKNALTAAHKSLPFGTEIEVKDTHTQKTVRVRINDRGPFIKGRILDLSEAAAKSLGIMNKGVTNIEIRVIKRG